MTRLAWLAAVVALAPAPAAACAVCLTSAYGDRSFNWAFAVFMLMPFVVAAGLCVAILVLVGRLSAGYGRTPPARPERQVARC